MGKRSEDWIPFHGWRSEDWGQAALVAGGVVAGALTGGLAYGAGAAAGAAVAVGATAGGAAGYFKGEEIKATADLEDREKAALARQEAEAINNEVLRKSSLLAAQQTMTAREAMARNVNAAIKNMYRPQTASNNPTPYILGGDEEVLG